MRGPSLRVLDVVPATAAGASALLGVAGISAWILGESAPPLLAPLLRMQFNSAVSLVTGAIGLLSLSRGWRASASIAAALLIAIGALTLAEYILQSDLGIDRLFFDSYLRTDNPHPGRIGANAASCFALLGIAFAALHPRRPTRVAVGICVASAVTVSIAGVWVVLLYATPLTSEGGLWRFAQMAAPTAAALTGLGIGTACIGVRSRMDWLGTKLEMRVPGLAWAVLGVSMFLAVSGWYVTAVNVVRVAEQRFESIAERMTLSIVGRMQDHEQVLMGMRGLLIASSDVTRAEWHDYVAQQELSARFRGMLGVGLATRVEPSERDAHVSAVRAEGHAAYGIVPDIERTVSYPVLYIEPFVGANLLVFGFDLYSDPVRREAMQRACETGALAISGRTSLLQDGNPDAQRGFLMFLPVVAAEGPAVPATDPCRGVRELIYSPFRTAEVLGDVVAEDLRGVDLRILDGPANEPASTLFDTATEGASDHGGISPLFEIARAVPMGGRAWTLAFSSRPAFGEHVAYHQPVAAMLGGVLVSVLLFGLTWSLATTRARALTLADEMTQRLRESEEQYRRLVDDSRGLICMHDLDGVLMYVNPAAAESLGVEPGALVGTRLEDLIVPEVRKYTADYLAAVRAERRHRGMMIVKTASGERRFWMYDNSLRDVPGQPPYVLGHAQDVTELRESQRALEDAHAAMRDRATRDSLTGLCNRWVFHEHLEQSIELARREPAFLAVLFLDLDHFKQVNDTLGHRAGDELLKHVARALRVSSRKSDVAARLGGDEFTLLLNHLADPKDAGRVAMKLIDELRRPLYFDGKALSVTGSIGIATYPADGADAETLVQRADEAMYDVKYGGRDGFRFRSEEPKPGS